MEYENSGKSLAAVFKFYTRGSLYQHLQSLCQSNYFGVEAEPVYSEQYPIKLGRMYQWGHDIACGLQFLASQRMIHRDVCAQNILLDDSFRCKVADFGITIQLPLGVDETKESHTKVALRRLPPEAHPPDSIFIFTATDVWSYGVTMWEILTLASKPYASISDLNLQNYLKTGGTLSTPAVCHNEEGKYLKFWSFIKESCFARTPMARSSWPLIISHFSMLTMYEQTKMANDSAYYGDIASKSGGRSGINTDLDSFDV